MGEITELEIQRLKDTESEAEWNAACDSIKVARGGQYPPNWYATVVMPGLAAEIMATWER